MKKYILLSLLLALPMTKAVAENIEVPGFDGPTWYDYREDITEGGGYEGNPFLIKTPGQLAMMAYRVNIEGETSNHYKLAADINLTKRIDGERVLWVPIGLNESQAFSGTLTNPDGHVITGMMIDVNSTATTQYFGLFGYLKGTVDGIRLAGNSEIKLSNSGNYNAGLLCGLVAGGSYVRNCNVEDSYITGTNLNGTVYIGGLIGYNSQVSGNGSENGRTYSCMVKTTISLKGNGSSSVIAGGVIGRSIGKVLDCHAVVDMTATDFSTSNNSYLGGIIGEVRNGAVKYCSASGDISAEEGIHAVTGGAFGSLNTNVLDIKIDYCVTTVAISGGYTLGGLIGYCYVRASLAVDFTSNFSSSYIDASNATYAGGFIGDMEYKQTNTGRDNFWLAQAGDVNGFIGTMRRPASSNYYGVILGHTSNVPNANLSVIPANQSRFYYNGNMCDYQIVGNGKTIAKAEAYGGQIPNDDGYGTYGIAYGNGASLQNPAPAALNNEVTADRLEMCNTDNYKLCALIFYITNDKKTLYKATDVTVDFSIEDITNSTTGERICQFTVPDNVTCVKVVDKHLYPLDPGEVVVTVKWNGLQRKVHLDITYGKDWEGGRNEVFEGGDGSQENPYLIHNADQFYSASRIHNQSGVYLKLASDIFFNTHLLQEDGKPRSDARAWDPYVFNGHLDGNGKTIYGLYVNKVSTAQDQSFGLFSNLYGSVENLAIVDSHVEVDAEHSGINVGMLCGSMKDGASVSNCLMHGNVVSYANRGGLCGNAEADNISITDIFSCVHVCQPGWPEKVLGADYSGGIVCYVSWDVMERCFSTGRVDDYSMWCDGIVNTDCITDCYYDAQMMDNPRIVRDYALTTKQILSQHLYDGKDKWQQEEERYPMLKTFADTPYGKLLVMPVLFDGIDNDAPFYDSHFLNDDWAGNVNYIFEFPTEDATWSALHDDTYIDVINDCGAASLVKETGDDVEMLIALSNNTESMCTRAMRTLPLNIRSGLTSFQFKDPIAQTAAEAAFDKEEPIGTLTLRELVEATKNDFATFNSNATGLQYFPEFRYFTSTTSLEEGMLSGLDQLSELQLPKKLQTIDTNAFNGCTSLEEITLPTTMSTLNEGGLYGSGIKNILVNPNHETMESIDGALFEMDHDGKLHLVAYPPGRGEADATISTHFEYIDDYAFYKIPELRNIYIDNCLPEGNLVIPVADYPIIHEDANDVMHIFVNDGSYDSRLFTQYEEDFYWGYEFYDVDHLHIYYPLNMTSAGWATLYIGFPTQLPEGFNAYVVKEMDEDTNQATLKNIGRVIPGTIPVVIKNVAGLASGVYPLTRWEGALPDIEKFNNRLVGTYIGQEDKWGIETNQESSSTGGTLTLGRNSQGVVGFYKYNGTEVPPYRAYLPYNTVIEGARGYSFIIDETIDDVPIGIQHPATNVQQSTTIYDIMGRPLQGKPSKRGVYINNGIKVVIK